MADERGSRPGAGGGRPQGKGAGDRRDGARSSDTRGGPKSGAARGGARGESRGDSRGKPPTGGRGGRREDWKRPTDRDVPRTVEQSVYDGPPLPDDVTGAELDRAVAAQLKGLPDKLAARIARHLAAAGLMVDSDPETAYQHALAARARAPRLAVVREAAGEAAYAAGHYAEALAELRAAKRMNGATAYLPIMADCHRAVGNPEQAIKLAKSPSVANFSPEAKAEMTLVESGARRDLGQLDAALRVLELAPLTSNSRLPWVVRLRYAYADTLVAAGREKDALAWFHRAHAIDSEELTDAAARADDLERRMDLT
ncbi:tetratricopeptide repeat protein [Nocardioides plantarum]|uniref:tetratricopeptide repeat protein n=1 Tax=Nocardioides plantarum TaxID=29299 RepID=UPI0036237F6B